MRSNLLLIVSVVITTCHTLRKTYPLSNKHLYHMIDELKSEKCFHKEECAVRWLEKLNHLSEKLIERGSYLSFDFETNITDYNRKRLEEFSPIANKFNEISLRLAKEFNKHSKHWNEVTRRMLMLSSRGFALKNEAEAKKLSDLSNRLSEIYATSKVCDNYNCYTLDQLNDIMATSRDVNRLKWAWLGWHNVTGSQIKHLFTQSVELQNKAARENGYSDLSEYWMDDFEVENFESIVDELYESIKPLYDQLYTFVRRKLINYYELDDQSKLIPEHLLGNMWSQSWENIFDIVQPYKNIPAINITRKLVEKNYRVKTIFRASENFFVSLGLSPMTKTFWHESMFERPVNRQVECHGSATDFSNGFDYRIKMCTRVNSEDFYVAHHEMGHIEYFMSYAHQPAVFRNGANSAFHEAIGDTIALSVYSQKHLFKIGLADSEDLSYEEMINYLMQLALKKVAFLPFSYLVDKWRWNVFRGNIPSDRYNYEWWNMKRMYQGVEAPFERNESFFDPASKYHIPTNVPYVRYFLSHFHQFEFYEALCELSGHKGPLHNCDFYESKRAGDALKNVLSLGNSKHWSHALEQLTGHSQIRASSILKYFKPLYQWLKNENFKLHN